MKYINRESDGHTYWHTVDGWMGTPTNLDGTPDLDSWSYVVDFEEYIAPEDYAALTDWLRTKICEGGDGCGTPPGGTSPYTVRPYLVKCGNEESRTVYYCDECANYVRVGWLPEVTLVEKGSA